MSDDEQPAFGYGAHDRPLWSVRDRDAEAVRALLHGAGYRVLADPEDDEVLEVWPA